MGVYGRIIRLPGMGLLLLATLLGRMPIGINGLALLLYTREVTGSYAIAGLIVGAYAIGSAAGAPFQGRLVDRLGRRMLVPLAALHVGGLVAIWALGSVGSRALLLAAAAFATGVVLPPVASVLRAAWPGLLRERRELIPAAFALDSVLIEVVFVSGPLLTAAIAATVGAQYALGVSAVCVLAGTVGFVARLGAAEAPAGDRQSSGLLGALASPGILTLVLATLPVGFCLGAIEVALPAFGEEAGSPERQQDAAQLAAAGGAAGGLLYGALPRRTSLTRIHVGLAMLLPLACLPLASAGSPLAMAFLALLAGAPITPLIASRNEIVGAVAPRGAVTEAFTWPLTALVSGVALGAAAGGTIVESLGWEAALLAGSGVAALGAAVLLARGLEVPVTASA
jgi:MFS family permease